MPYADYDVAALARYLRVAPGDVARMAEKGSLPARKVSGQWRFAQAEIHHWLEDRMAIGDQADLAQVQGLLDRAALDSSALDKEPATVRVSELLVPESIAIPLDARTRNSAISAIVEVAEATGLLWDVPQMTAAVREREDLHSTALDSGVALLHPRRPLPQILAQPLLALGRTHHGIPFGNESGQLTDLFFLICSVDDSQHLRTLARLSRLIAAEGFVPALRAAADAQTVRILVTDYEHQLDRE